MAKIRFHFTNAYVNRSHSRSKVLHIDSKSATAPQLLNRRRERERFSLLRLGKWDVAITHSYMASPISLNKPGLNIFKDLSN